MSLETLYIALANVLDGPQEIECAGRAALLEAATVARATAPPIPLPDPFQAVMAAPDAHPACALVAMESFAWVPPQTSTDPAYIAHSAPKVHVELVGPSGLAKSDTIRLGLYGMMPKADYGIRTHPAEETFVMMAGEAYWKRGDAPYAPLRSGERSYHPTMLPHATRTGAKAFLSLYVWHGDIGTENYVYAGIPEG